MKKISILVILLFINFFSAVAQLTTTGNFTAQQLASYLAGPNITVYNATITGSPISYGRFQTGTNPTNLGISKGIVLTTGSRNNIIGPNNVGDKSNQNNSPGDAMLNTISGAQTRDACVLQFQFDVQSESVEFNYVFGSEEYPEYVNAGFNDVFAFYISGPGITGWQNIALVPNTTTPVTIDNINGNSYWQYYVNNDNGTTVQYDGFTKVLTAKKTGLIPCQTYTLRLAIADAGDNAIDSGVMLEAGSLKQGTISAITQTANADTVALEGCTKAKFVFSLDSAQSTNTIVDFEIAGSAINGVDYQFVDTLFILPAGQTSATITIDALSDGITEGLESIFLIYTPYPCAPKDTVKLYINDYQTLQYENALTNVSCFNANNGIINFTTNGGSPPYTYFLKDSITGIVTTYTSNPVTGLSPGTYFVNVEDGYGCPTEAIIAGNQYVGPAVMIPDGNGQTYVSSLNISGFSSTSTLQNTDQIQSICVNMEHSRMEEVQIKVQAPNGQEVILKQFGGGNSNLGEPCAIGPADVGNTDNSIGVAYGYCFNNNASFGTMVSEANNNLYTYTATCTGNAETDNYLPQGLYTSFGALSGLIGAPINGDWKIIITDNTPGNNGWNVDWGIGFAADLPEPIVNITQPSRPTLSFTTVKPNCGASNGSINITVNGDTGPYTYLWSNETATEDLSNVPAGSYTVSVTTSTNCTYDYTVPLSNNGTLILTNTVSNVTCFGSNNGSINLSVNGGNAPFNYLWSNASTVQDISGLATGVYSVRVTDAAGCIGILNAEITQPTTINIASTLVNETCGNQNGEIQLTVTGGVAPYSYLWSNGSNAEDPNFLEAGNYNVIISDANNCQKNRSFTINNEVTNCSINCDVTFSNSLITNETCGNNNGAIDVSVVNGLFPFQYNWSNGSTNQDLINLQAGTYSLTVTDSKNCSINQIFTVTNNSGTLEVTAQVTNQFCGNPNGTINQTISGGTLPYSILWNNGATNEDRNGLSAGIYTSVITDATGCEITKTYTISNITNTLTQTYGNAVDEVCGNQTGSIDITITGGALPYSYLWSNGATTQDITNLQAGVYSCTVTANNGCKLFTPSYTINNNSGTLAIFDIDIINEVCGNGQGRLNVDIVGGTAPFQFFWSNAQTSQTITNLGSGVYTCVIADINGCFVNTGPLSIGNSAGTLEVTGLIVTNETCNDQSGTINLSLSGGSNPITYNWNNGATTEDLTGLNAGSYSCIITDINGCTVNANGIVTNTNGTLQVATPSVVNESCGNSNGSITIIPSGGILPYIFNWSNGAQTQNLNAISAGNYSCSITDAAGCNISLNASVTNQTGNLNANFTTINENCNNSNGSINLTVTGGTLPYVYSWNNGATTQDLSGLSVGTYSCSIRDANNCIFNTTNISINNVSGNLQISSSNVINENCGDGTGAIDVTITGGANPLSYNWSNGATTQDISGLSAGSYTLSVTGTNGCSTTRIFNVQNLSGTFVYNGQVVTPELCGNGLGSITISYNGGTAPVSFLWNNGATTQNISGLSAGSYSVTITDANGCAISSQNINLINSSGTLQVSNPVVVNEVCNNDLGSISISVSGGAGNYTYNWSNGLTTEDIANLSSGTYSCTITDANNCSYNIGATILNTSGNLAIINSTITDAFCGNLGLINLTTSGSQPINYLWSNNATTEDISGLTGGTYSCVISDALGCVITFSANINTADGPIATIVSEVDDNCAQNSGSIDINVTNGTPGYTFTWSNGATTEDINFLNAGTYTCVVRDANGCETTIISTIDNITPFTSTGVVTDESCVGCADGSIDITTINTGPNPLQFFWDPISANTEDITGLTAGVYTLYVYESFCFVSYTFTVNTTVGIKDNSVKDNSINVYPNPSTGMFTVKLSDELVDVNSMEIINTIGELIYEIKTTDNKIKNNEFKINLSEFDNGVYYLRCKTKDKYYIKKLILTK